MKTTSKSKGFYSVIASGTIRSNTKYHVTISVHKAVENCQFKIGIKGGSFEEYKVIDVQEMSTEHLSFDIPTLKEDSYHFLVEGLKGIVFKEEAKDLTYSDNRPMVLIQTDKATYKPADLVQFRVLFLDKDTRPAKLDKPVNVSISDGERNRLKYWKNVELKKGVYAGKYQLSEQPVLGQWNIEISVEGQMWGHKTFEVEKYVLPKFSAAIETAKDVAFPDGIINVTIRSKYTYGKPVKGRAVVVIQPAFLFSVQSMWGEKPRAEKTIDVDGKGQTTFRIVEDLHLEAGRNHYLSTMKVTAVVEEELTGSKQDAPEATVQVHKYRHCFEGVDLPRSYKPEQKLVLKVAVKNIDQTPVTDTKNPVKLHIEAQRAAPLDNSWRCFSGPGMPETPPMQDKVVKDDVVLESRLDERGMATFEHTFPEDCENYYYLKCEYLGSEGQLSSICREVRSAEDVPELIKLKVLTESPKLGDTVEIELTSSETIPYFIYSIVAKGSLVKTERLELESDQKSHIIKITPTFDMVPKASVFVHYVVGDQLRFVTTTIDVQKQFLNSINISVPAEAQPSEDVTINIETDIDSYVGLLGVDQSVLLLRAGNDLTKDQLFSGLQKYDASSPFGSYFGEAPGSRAGLITFTNASFPTFHPRRCYAMPLARGFGASNSPIMKKSANQFATTGFASVAQSAPQPEVKIRKEFPENWIFDDIESINARNFVLKKKVPDTITSWVITGVSVHPISGVAITENPSIIKTFRPFFIGTNLPYSIKRGEVFALPVIVFNYMENDLEADVILDNSDQEFDFIDMTGEKKGSNDKRTQHICIAANNGATVNFPIRPRSIGNIILKISAISPIAGDAVHKELKVEPEGITVFKNRDFYMHSEGSQIDEARVIDLKIPEKIVPDSEIIEVTAMGNILGSTITNIDKLVRMPYGCGEQNMVNFVPNILVLWYLESIDELSPAIEDKAKRFLEIGYQRELTYKHDDGSYSAFGKSDAAGSTWLTAYVMRSFHQAKKYIDIDAKILESGLVFLAGKQAADGSFEEKGRLFDNAHLNPMGLTAFVLMAFLENTEYADKHRDTIDRGFEYLQQNIRNCEDLYALAVVSYALQQRKLESVHEILAKLETFSRIDGGHKWWSQQAQPKEADVFLRARSQDVEITGYILMTLLDMNISALPITRWMISQRNSNGGFNSSQETVVGLWALIKFAEKMGAAKPDMSIEVKSDKVNESKHFKINKENSLVVQSIQLPRATRQVSFGGKGSGTAVLQVSYQYNVANKEVRSSFKLRTEVKEQSASGRLSLDVLTEYSPEPVEGGVQLQGDTSNMAVLDVALPSGYVAVPESFEKIKDIQCVKRVETKNQNSSIVIYFDSLKASEEKCIPIEAELAYDVTDQKPAPVVIYDYYDDLQRATDFYKI